MRGIMTEEELNQRIRQKRKMERLRARRRKLIVEMICCAFVILFTISGIVRCTAHRREEKELEQKRIEAFEKKKKQEAAEKKKEQEDPRKQEFALDPSKTAGSENHLNEKIVYLTFDDGPSELTPKVLEILDKYDAKATFFVTNHDKKNAHYIKEAYQKGHTIGMHTSTHDYGTVYSSVDAYFADLDAISQTVKEQIGYIPCFIRFPGGSSNTVSSITPGLMTVLTAEVQKRGYQYYDWNSGCGDGSVRTTQELITAGTTFTENNLLYLAHDSATKETTVEALSAIIEHYKNQGYVFKAIDRETITAHHGVNN